MTNDSTGIMPTPENRWRKRAVPQASRRALAARAGATPGDHKFPTSCAYCGAPGSVTWWKPNGWVSFTGLEMDHVHPEVFGGPSTPDNLVLACRSCNRRKATKDVETFKRVVNEP